MNVIPWESISNEPMSLDVVQKIYPAKRYRVQYDYYTNHSPFLMGGRSGNLWCIIKGTGIFSEEGGGQEVHIKSGEVIAFSSGSFFFEIFGDEPFKFIKVLEIPEGCI